MSQNQVIDHEGAGVRAGPRPVVHLELHTGDLSGASDFYAQLLRWQTARIDTEHGRYLALGLGGEITGGVVECATERPLWLPYVEVDRIDEVTERARALGASVLLGPREGPAGWRSVISAPGAGQVALWQPKEWR
jgi:predicted enzyme related to lactoylglutathione lyase